MRRFWIVLAVLCLLPWGAAVILLLRPVKQTEIPNRLPTRLVLPEPTAITRRPTHPATATVTATASQTVTPTETATVTATSTPTPTVTLATRVMGVEAVMPGVQVLPTTTPFPSGTTLLPAPPQPVEPLPDATLQPPPYLNWYSFESDHPAVVYATPWQARQVREASRGQYHRSDDVNSSISFAFEGEGLRIRYVAARNMGMFDILVDGIKVDVIDAYASELRFPGTKVYFVGAGIHQLTIRSSGRKNAFIPLIQQTNASLSVVVNLAFVVAGVLGDTVEHVRSERERSGQPVANGLDHLAVASAMAQSMGLTPLPGQPAIPENLSRFGLFADQALRIGLSGEQTERVVREVKTSPDGMLPPETRESLIGQVRETGNTSWDGARAQVDALENRARLLPEFVVAFGEMTVRVDTGKGEQP